MKRATCTSLFLAILASVSAPAATVETRNHTILQGSVAFATNTLTVTDQSGQIVTVSLKDLRRVTLFDPPPTVGLTNADWTSADVGEVITPGATASTNGEVALTASGWGLWRDADGFRFTSVPWSGDGEIIARVQGFDDTHGTVVAGLSIRESLAPRARHVSIMESSRGAVNFRARGDEGFTRHPLPGERHQAWLRLTRLGSNLTAYVSDDARNWTPVESASISSTQELRAGFFAATEINTFTGTARFREVTVRTGTQPQGAGDLPAPAVVLRDGTILAGEFTATNETVRFRRGGVTRDFSIHGLAALLFRPVTAQLALQPAISPTTGVVMKDRDWLEGEVREFTPQGIVLGTVLFGAKTVRWADHPAAVVLGGRTDTANWELILKDGSQIRARDFVMSGPGGVAHTAALAEFPFTRAELLEIRAVR